MKKSKKKNIEADTLNTFVKNGRGTFKVNQHRYELFVMLCYKNNETPSEVLRNTVDEYLKKHNNGSQLQLFDTKKK